ncbi:hypothetical protein M8C21_027674 [Ambrosia artemisiifolia]|uniref:Uncharacterized protein n=1 Tax=Ambrosia artemisiifolia TaxID=4212 RepID=A0AAD5DET7_AMBAR|nr:hypothetical protein M8C21_027674 [Ambrosia artemisiifolia]
MKEFFLHLFSYQTTGRVGSGRVFKFNL